MLNTYHASGMQPKDDRWLSPKEAARFLGCHRTRLYQLAGEGKIKSRRTIFSKSESRQTMFQIQFLRDDLRAVKLRNQVADELDTLVPESLEDLLTILAVLRTNPEMGAMEKSDDKRETRAGEACDRDDIDGGRKTGVGTGSSNVAARGSDPTDASPLEPLVRRINRAAASAFRAYRGPRWRFAESYEAGVIPIAMSNHGPRRHGDPGWKPPGNPIRCAQFAERPERAAVERRLNCVYYDRCLTYAAESGWDGFTCRECTAGVDKTVEQLRAEVFGIMETYAMVRGKRLS
jgi:hypothetical protein